MFLEYVLDFPSCKLTGFSCPTIRRIINTENELAPVVCNVLEVLMENYVPNIGISVDEKYISNKIELQRMSNHRFYRGYTTSPRNEYEILVVRQSVFIENEISCRRPYL